MDQQKQKHIRQLRRKRHVRRKITGTSDRPRLSVFRSCKHIYAQLIDDLNGVTLASASSKSKKLNLSTGANSTGAKEVGKAIAEEANEKGITTVAFDRGHYKYHGRIRALADAAREGGLKF